MMTNTTERAEERRLRMAVDLIEADPVLLGRIAAEEGVSTKTAKKSLHDGLTVLKHGFAEIARKKSSKLARVML